jgi:hypothetical protein
MAAPLALSSNPLTDFIDAIILLLVVLLKQSMFNAAFLEYFQPVALDAFVEDFFHSDIHKAHGAF